MSARLPYGQYPAFLDNADEAPACRGYDTEEFFPPRGNHGEFAKAICSICPLEQTCREWALDQPEAEVFGIWGGMNDKERRDWHRAKRAEAAKVAEDECGYCGAFVGNFRRIHIARNHPQLVVAA